jgi:polyhydroxyalkanoate synthesis regulator phasin
VVDDIRHRQDHIQFLENYITDLTRQIDEITGGMEYEKRIMSLEYRLEVLQKADHISFNGRIKNLKSELKNLQDEYVKIKPVIDELEEERAYYRTLQNEL